MFNPFKRSVTRNSASKPDYKIVQCETKVYESEQGVQHVLMLAADLNHALALDALLGDLVERFKVQRMVSPPETSMLLLTIIGPCKASEVAEKWRTLVAKDPVAHVWMSRMTKADVGAVRVKGETTEDFHSLLPVA